jgi:hypothetical protein
VCQFVNEERDRHTQTDTETHTATETQSQRQPQAKTHPQPQAQTHKHRHTATDTDTQTQRKRQTHLTEMRRSLLVHTPAEVAPAVPADTAARSSTAALSNLRPLELQQQLLRQCLHEDTRCKICSKRGSR